VWVAVKLKWSPLIVFLILIVTMGFVLGCGNNLSMGAPQSILTENVKVTPYPNETAKQTSSLTNTTQTTKHSTTSTSSIYTSESTQNENYTESTNNYNTKDDYTEPSDSRLITDNIGIATPSSQQNSEMTQTNYPVSNQNQTNSDKETSEFPMWILYIMTSLIFVAVCINIVFLIFFIRFFLGFNDIIISLISKKKF